ncbi:hypothetical protein V2B08_23545, partial [Pseudomonas aeruginosa]
MRGVAEKIQGDLAAWRLEESIAAYFQLSTKLGKTIRVIDRGRPQKLSATPDLSGTVLPLCPIPNS